MHVLEEKKEKRESTKRQLLQFRVSYDMTTFFVPESKQFLEAK